jgi:hypothetical protein
MKIGRDSAVPDEADESIRLAQFKIAHRPETDYEEF